MYNESIRNQTAAIVGVIILATLAVAPWLIVSHILTPWGKEYNQIIQSKDDLLVKKSRLEDELKAYQNMAEKKEVNDRFHKNIEQTSIDALQVFFKNGKHVISGFKTVQQPETKEIRFIFSAEYNTMGQIMSDLWNNFQFVEVSSLTMRPSPIKPEEDVIVTLVLRMPAI